MSSLNKTLIIGNLTRDPEIKYTASGKAVAEIGVAVTRKFDNNGTKKEETTFIDVTLWGRTAEVAKEYLTKGASVFIEGRLQLDTWDDKQTGQKRSKLRVVGENLQMLGSKQKSEQPQTRPVQQQSRPAASPAPDIEEDDIPF